MNLRLPAWMLWLFLAAFGATSGQAAVDARNSNMRDFSAPVAVSIDPYAALEEILRSNGGELHRYVMKFGIPPELASHFEGAFGEETFRIMDDETYGVVLEDPENPGKPMNITFAMHDGEAPPVESETDYNKRITELQNASFLKGFTWGVGYGGIDLITSTGKAIAGTARFVGRGILQVALRVRWTAQWMTGGNTAATQELIVEVDSAQAAVIREKLQIAKFLGKLLVESAGVLGKIEVGLITGDLALVETALHGSETHRKIFEMCAEVLVQTMKDYGSGSPGQKGYITGRIVFEAGSFLLPFTKAGTLMQATKSQMITRLLQRVGPGLKSGAQGVATAVKTVCDGGCFKPGTPVLTSSGQMPIESVEKGDLVWAQNEHAPAESGWRRVLEVRVTHPRELHHLTYEVRGPPGAPVLTETLGVTAEHPFWVERAVWQGFLPAGELRAGDVLRCFDDARAVVTENRAETTRDGTLLTTYNLSVEGFHTFFVGRTGIWVHNLYPHLTARENIRSVIFNRIKPVQIEQLGKDRFKKLDEAKRIMKARGDVLPDGAWATEARDCCEYMMREAAAIPPRVALGDIPSVRNWNNFFDRVPGNGKGVQHVHHAVESWIQKDYLQLSGNVDDVPGWILRADEHTFGEGRNKVGTLYGDLDAAIRNKIDPQNHLAVAQAIKKVYEDRGLFDLWSVTRQWLITKGRPVP